MLLFLFLGFHDNTITTWRNQNNNLKLLLYFLKYFLKVNINSFFVISNIMVWFRSWCETLFLRSACQTDRHTLRLYIDRLWDRARTILWFYKIELCFLTQGRVEKMQVIITVYFTKSFLIFLVSSWLVVEDSRTTEGRWYKRTVMAQTFLFYIIRNDIFCQLQNCVQRTKFSATWHC